MVFVWNDSSACVCKNSGTTSYKKSLFEVTSMFFYEMVSLVRSGRCSKWSLYEVTVNHLIVTSLRAYSFHLSLSLSLALSPLVFKPYQIFINASFYLQLKKLRVIDISSLPGIVPADLATLIQFCPDLQAMNVSLNPEINDECLLQVVKYGRHLHLLQCVSCRITDHCMLF